jgi:CheY-like chemotaxis protein
MVGESAVNSAINSRRQRKTAQFLSAFLYLLLLLGLPDSRIGAQSPTPTPVVAQPPDTGGTEIIILVGVAVIALFVLPMVLLLFRKPPRELRSLLLVSTDETARRMVISAARKVGYQTIHVYRYEDALDKLRQNLTIRMIAVDDSVPQYEAGLLISMLNRLPIGIRPLILIQDSSEMGQTAPSYRAESVVSRPLTERAIETAIRKVAERTEIDL